MAGVMKIAGPFLSKDRKPGDVITDEELSHCTEQTKVALVSNGIMEIEGFASKAGGSAMDAATKELIGLLVAQFDTFREAYVKDMVALNNRLDAVLGSAPKAAAKRSKGR